MNKLILIDGNAILHRAYHALPPLTTKDGQPINAVYGFITMLLRNIQDLKPTHIAVAFDEKKPTFRHAQFAGYQSHRPRTDSELVNQFKLARKVMKAFNIPYYSKSRYEADDVIGTIVHKLVNNKSKKASIDQVVIVTGDHDILQLVNKRVKVLMPVKGLSQGKLFGVSEVKEKLGVNPDQIIEYKALVGDPSDNYPGVRGIGPKTATSLIEKYKTVENIYKHLNDIPQTIAKKLAENAENAALSKNLATILKDTPITFNLSDTKNWNIASPKVIKLFEKFGFNTLTKRVQSLSQQNLF